MVTIMTLQGRREGDWNLALGSINFLEFTRTFFLRLRSQDVITGGELDCILIGRCLAM